MPPGYLRRPRRRPVPPAQFTESPKRAQGDDIVTWSNGSLVLSAAYRDNNEACGILQHAAASAALGLAPGSDATVTRRATSYAL